jgi:cytochrome b6-f complex iron-sulfur subunit
LYYIWGASIALLTAQGAGLLVWFLIPRFREGEFGGLFPITFDQMPEVNGPPTNVADGRFWLVNLDTNSPNARMALAPDENTPIQGVAAIYKVCTHLGCIYDWTPANERFECPCHGSKYRLDGRRIEAPAPRTLDRFKMVAYDENRNVLAESPLVDDFSRRWCFPQERRALALTPAPGKEVLPTPAV